MPCFSYKKAKAANLISENDMERIVAIFLANDFQVHGRTMSKIV
jgi:hypothetical protein